jgi:monothiol glutaredoxin
MPLSEAVRQKISETVNKHPVVLFMKGNRRSPQCGFSSQVVQILDAMLDDYTTLDVLADPELRDGIKQYSDWPTIPQLYVKGEFLGGCDIVKGMAQNGELRKKLGVAPEAPPQITITAAAAAAIRDAAPPGGDEVLHLEIDGQFSTNMGFGPREPGEIEITAGGIIVLMDTATARRAQGLSIDFVGADAAGAPGGFRIDNPKAPPPVKQITATELKALLAKGKIELFDVRTPAERAKASIPGSRLLDDAAAQHIASLDKSTPLYFHCHHGSRSQSAAEHFRQEGFTRIHNLQGGIDAWSEIDPTVAHY